MGHTKDIRPTFHSVPAHLRNYKHTGDIRCTGKILNKYEDRLFHLLILILGYAWNKFKIHFVIHQPSRPMVLVISHNFLYRNYKCSNES